MNDVTIGMTDVPQTDGPVMITGGSIVTNDAKAFM